MTEEIKTGNIAEYKALYLSKKVFEQIASATPGLDATLQGFTAGDVGMWIIFKDGHDNLKRMRQQDFLSFYVQHINVDPSRPWVEVRDEAFDWIEHNLQQIFIK